MTLAIASPFLSAGATLLTFALSYGRRQGNTETTLAAHTKVLESLPDVLKGFVTQSEGKGFQAQLDRLERSDNECEGKISAQRQEAADRIERLSTRVTAHEQSTNAQTAATSQAMARLETLMISMKESVDRLSEAERQRHSTPPANDMFTQLEQLVRLGPLLKQIAQ